MSPADWRAIGGRVAATFSTPLAAVLAMEWHEVLLWWREACDIDAETWGVLRSMRP